MNEQPDNDRKPTSLADRVRSLQLSTPALDRAQSRTTWLPWVLCLALAGLSAYLGYRVVSASASNPAEENRTSNTRAVQNSENRGPGSIALEAGGFIVPAHKVQVSPKVGGQVVELFIEEGMFVRKGDVLARLEANEYQYDYDRTVALVDQAWAKYVELATGNREEEKKQAEAALNEAKAARDQLKDELHRMTRAYSAASQEDLVKVKSRLSQAEHKVKQLEQAYKLMLDGPRVEQVEAAWANYLHALAERDRAKYRLDNTEVRAPVSGVILVKRAEVGDTVRPEAFSTVLSASLCDMADLRELEVDVDVSERDLKRVFKGQKCKLWAEADPKKVYDGVVSRIMPVANKGKASVAVRVRILFPSSYLLIGEKATATGGWTAQPIAWPGVTVPLAGVLGPQEFQEPDFSLRPDMRARVQFLASGGRQPAGNRNQ